MSNHHTSVQNSAELFTWQCEFNSMYIISQVNFANELIFMDLFAEVVFHLRHLQKDWFNMLSQGKV